MPIILAPSRYAHPEGHTDVCYYPGEKGGIATCGADGDIRTWFNLMDDDPSSSCIAESVTAVVCKGEYIYAGNDNNNISIVRYRDLEKEGFLTRFSAPVTALATAKNSDLIVSGSGDMRIQISNVKTKEHVDLHGHEAVILGLSLDPKEEYVASSSADGTIRIWNIKEGKVEHMWSNIVPTCNSFLTAKALCTPSFQCKDGSILAYLRGKEVILVERSTWKEISRLKCSDLKSELSICKFSECGKFLAASSLIGEIVVWEVENKQIVGYALHPEKKKITSLVWHLEFPKEVMYCDSTGQLGCAKIEHLSPTNGNAEMRSIDLETDYPVLGEDDDDEDNENACSLNAIKASANLQLDEDGSDASSVRASETKAFLPKINRQKPFQPGSSPVHCFSRYLVWNDVGVVGCYPNEDEDESSIEIEFADTAVHHSLRLKNLDNHTMAALSKQAVVMSGPPSNKFPSKVVVLVLQAWGGGTQEWTTNLPEDEKSLCVAAGDTFVAVATSKGLLRLFTIMGTQKQILAIPGPVVCMNARKNQLLVAYHAGIGGSEDQCMKLMWIKISGKNFQNETIDLPLAPSSKLIWLGFSDSCSPTIMDTSDMIKIYKRNAEAWIVACDTSTQCNNKSDHFFIIGVNDYDRMTRAILCKGSYYPPVSPKPFITEIPMVIPLCEPESDKTENEIKLWPLVSDQSGEEQAMLLLVAIACRNKALYRAVELCQHIASQKVVEKAIEYARRQNLNQLEKKLRSIAENKNYSKKEDEEEEALMQEKRKREIFEEKIDETEDDLDLISVAKEVGNEIRPLPILFSQSSRRSNKFLKNPDSPSGIGLAGLDTLVKKPVLTPETPKIPKAKVVKTKPKTVSFMEWFKEKKESLQKEYPELDASSLTKKALEIFKNDGEDKMETPKAKKRKTDNDTQKSTAEKLAAFKFQD